MGALAGIMSVMVAGVALVVGVFVLAQVQASVVSNTNSSGIFSGMFSVSSNQSAAISNVFNTAFSFYNLLTVALIVLAAVAILAIIVEGIGRGAPSLPTIKRKPKQKPVKGPEAEDEPEENNDENKKGKWDSEGWSSENSKEKKSNGEFD